MTIAVVVITAGRPLGLSAVYGVANGAEVWVVERLLTRGDAHAQPRTMREMGWLLVSHRSDRSLADRWC